MVSVLSGHCYTCYSSAQCYEVSSSSQISSDLPHRLGGKGGREGCGRGVPTGLSSPGPPTTTAACLEPAGSNLLGKMNPNYSLCQLLQALLVPLPSILPSSSPGLVEKAVDMELEKEEKRPGWSYSGALLG